MRVETGNPAGDDLRERLAALTGIPLVEILSQMKKDKQETEKKSKGIRTDHEKEKKFKEVLKRTHVAGAASLSLVNMKTLEDKDATDKSKKNINKAFTVKPKSPSKRVVMDALRETGKNLIVPNAEEAKAKAAKLAKKLAKARQKKREQIDEAAKSDQVADQTLDVTEQSHFATCLPKQYKGDLFGTSGDMFEGTLYLSRMLNSTHKAKWSDPFIAEWDDQGEAYDSQILGSSSLDTFEEDGTLEVSAAEQGHETDMSAKLYCAISLCNWARNPANAQRLAAEGAIKASFIYYLILKYLKLSWNLVILLPTD